MAEEMEVATTNVEVLVGLSRVEGQLSAFIQLMSAQGEALTKVTTDIGQLRDRVTALEASSKATEKAAPPRRSGWEVASVVIPLAVVVLALLDRLYLK